jgi:hypothetical protein
MFPYHPFSRHPRREVEEAAEDVVAEVVEVVVVDMILTMMNQSHLLLDLKMLGCL